MKAVVVDRFGRPDEVARCVEVPDPGWPEQGEVLLEVLAFPVNPADVWFCRGSYPVRLPASPGAECVARVRAIGPQVDGFGVGDLVIPHARGNWMEQRCLPAADLVRLPADIDLLQAAMLKVNPPTAMLLLSDLVELAPGEWVIQNVANSAVGRHLIRFAKVRGLRTVNVVRRESVFAELAALGADACVLDGDGLADRVAAITGDAPIRLGIDAVGGRATARLSDCVADGGVVCHYGSMSGDDPVIPRGALIYRGVQLTGFMIGRALTRRTRTEVQGLFDELAQMVRGGRLLTPVEAVYSIESIGDALRHAMTGERGGKILVRTRASR